MRWSTQSICQVSVFLSSFSASFLFFVNVPQKFQLPQPPPLCLLNLTEWMSLTKCTCIRKPCWYQGSSYKFSSPSNNSPLLPDIQYQKKKICFIYFAYFYITLTIISGVLDGLSQPEVDSYGCYFPGKKKKSLLSNLKMHLDLDEFISHRNLCLLAVQSLPGNFLPLTI